MKERDEGLPTLSGKERLVMELLLEEPGSEKYGLQLVRASRGGLKQGTVYVTLGRMEEKEFVESREVPPPDSMIGLPRRLYRVTGYGRRVYEAWEVLRKSLLGLEVRT